MRHGGSRRRRMRGALVAAICWGLAWSSYPAVGAGGNATLRKPHVAFSIDIPDITESSSLVNSGVHPGLVYTANDSGDGPYVYVLDHDGHLVGTTTLAGVHPVDVEALGGAPDGSLVVADIGDNGATRASIEVYRISQPTRGDHTVTPDKVTLTYTDGPHDAESVLYDIKTQQLLVVTKEASGEVYETSSNVFSSDTATLRP